MQERQDRTRNGEDRTDLAEDRTVLANERTCAGWMRTGFGSVGLGPGFNALTRSFDPDWIGKVIATAFLTLGVVIFVAAYRRVHRVQSRLDAHAIRPAGIAHLKYLTAAFAAGTLAIAIGMWVLA